MLTYQDFGLRVVTGIEAEHGYIRWFYSISHPHIIAPSEAVHILRPLKQKTLDEIAPEQEGDH